MTTQYTWAQLAQNKTWIVIEGKVYDPTNYLNEHPGGPAVIQNRGGKDATRDFQETGHTNGAREKLKAYQIGVIDPKSVPEPWQSTGGTPANVQNIAIVLIALVGLYIAYLCFK